MSKRTYQTSIVFVLFGMLTSLGISPASEARMEHPPAETIGTTEAFEIPIQPLPISIKAVDFDSIGRDQRSEIFITAGGGERGSKEYHSKKGRHKGYRNQGSKKGYKSYEDSGRYKGKDSYKYSEEEKKYGYGKEGKTKGDFKESKEYNSPLKTEKDNDFGVDSKKPKEPVETEEKSKPAVE